ncbi:hypothetical protein C4544_03520 [candidate division WS5 bacterium]|uniref:DUF5652 domain-containing protein n=1 Tax=candidate division WS5 bacterium TaxID=2093353 RepID=A0A419DDL7_9BACT|nr:MAG: hypothetical protein C4544_03520 [candidate division WS5 bacterium]
MDFSQFGLNNIPASIIALLVVWEAFWKAVALWYAILNKQRNWFIAIFVVNTIGILPIVYLKFFQKK